MLLHNLNDFRVATVGFDQLFNWLNSMEKAPVPTFPPHDIIKLSDEDYRIDLACAGYDSNSIDVDMTDGILTVASNKKESDDTKSSKELYRGISKKSFKKQFALPDDIIVEKATMHNGMLSIHLKKVLPKKKNIKIEIEK